MIDRVISGGQTAANQAGQRRPPSPVLPVRMERSVPSERNSGELAKRLPSGLKATVLSPPTDTLYPSRVRSPWPGRESHTFTSPGEPGRGSVCFQAWP